jgi:hypothetical protein
MKPSMDMTRTRRTALVWLLLCCGISVFWGSSIERVSPYGIFDFKGVYYYARCLLQHSDPYKKASLCVCIRQKEEDLPTDVLPVLFR